MAINKKRVTNIVSIQIITDAPAKKKILYKKPKIISGNLKIWKFLKKVPKKFPANLQKTYSKSAIITIDAKNQNWTHPRAISAQKYNFVRS
jgi:hypothetical protein